MVVDLIDVTPFLTWLFGPGWTEGFLFHTLPLSVFLLVMLGGLVWLVRAIRAKEGLTSPTVGVWISVTLTAAILVLLIGLTAWKSLPAETTASISAKFVQPLGWLLGSQWYAGAAYQWLKTAIGATGLVFATALLILALRRGPREAFVVTGQSLGDTVLDVLRMSPRRVAALALLAVKESIRRRVVVVFALFILLLLFAGWYLDPQSVDPARLYLDFVLTATTYLVLLLALFISALSLPADIKNRTLYTIVTKPVRTSEIILGRILGFLTVATVLLVAMGGISYLFVLRGLAHEHELTADLLQPAEGTKAEKDAKQIALRGATSRVHHHRHKVTITPDASGAGIVERETQPEQGHVHPIKVRTEGNQTAYEIGREQGMLLARVPVYGKLSFRDRTGQPTEKGISVGDEWTYRSYIEGGTLAAAVWSFEGLRSEDFPEHLPVELSIEIFRTYKGNIEKGILGSLSVRNPKTGKKVEVRFFEGKEFVIDVQQIPRRLSTPDGKTVDLFKDMVDEGKLEVWLQCAEPMQYFGVAQGDLYLRARDASFFLNFVKGYVGIWLQTAIVIALGVLFSTFLSAPVAVLATLGAIFGGFFSDFMYRLATGKTYGGGPFESIIRLVTQANVTSELEPGLRTNVAKTLDQIVEFGMRLLASVLPDFSRFNFAEFVASGFNIPGDTLMAYTCRTLGFVIPIFVAAYLCLKNREVAQ